MGRGKKTDRMYMTQKEWATEFGGRAASSAAYVATNTTMTTSGADKSERLSFDCCSLSLQPWLSPVCDCDGNIFELKNIVPFVKRFRKNPITGLPMGLEDLITLQFHKNGEGKFCCPVTFEAFNSNSRITAVSVTGNVYNHKTIQELNISGKNWKDLVSDEPFTSKNLICLQNPLEERLLPSRSNWFLNKTSFKVPSKEEEPLDDGRANATNPSTSTAVPSSSSTSTSTSSKDLIMAEFHKKHPPVTQSFVKSASEATKDDPFTAHYSTGKMAASLTSTSMNIVTKQESAKLDVEQVLFDQMKLVKKLDDTRAYVRLVTSHGDINLELYCNKASSYDVSVLSMNPFSIIRLQKLALTL